MACFTWVLAGGSLTQRNTSKGCKFRYSGSLHRTPVKVYPRWEELRINDIAFKMAESHSRLILHVTKMFFSLQLEISQLLGYVT